LPYYGIEFKRVDGDEFAIRTVTRVHDRTTDINNTYFNGEINEILVYNRVLSADEAGSVEKYLRNKFGTQ